MHTVVTLYVISLGVMIYINCEDILFIIIILLPFPLIALGTVCELFYFCCIDSFISINLLTYKPTNLLTYKHVPV